MDWEGCLFFKVRPHAIQASLELAIPECWYSWHTASHWFCLCMIFFKTTSLGRPGWPCILGSFLSQRDWVYRHELLYMTLKIHLKRGKNSTFSQNWCRYNYKFIGTTKTFICYKWHGIQQRTWCWTSTTLVFAIETNLETGSFSADDPREEEPGFGSTVEVSSIGESLAITHSKNEKQRDLSLRLHFHRWKSLPGRSSKPSISGCFNFEEGSETESIQESVWNLHSTEMFCAVEVRGGSWVCEEECRKRLLRGLNPC